MRRASRAAGLVLGSLLSACISLPHVSPFAKAVDDPAELGLKGPSSQAQDTWWVEYQDSQLDRLVNEALAENPTLEQALARLRLAQAAVDAARAGLWPNLAYDANLSRERFSGKDVIPPPYSGSKVWRGSEELSFSWELDFWGRQSSLLRQARSEADATALDAAAARLAIIGAVVRTYFELERSYELVEVAEREERQRQDILDITRHRFEAGLDTSVELRQAAGAVPEARVERLAVQAELDRDVHLLAALTGHGGGQYLEIQRPRVHADRALSAPSALPVDLLARRPDVLASRLRVTSARAGLQVARADFYPNIDLVAFAGTQAIGLDNLFQGAAGAFGVGPALHLPVFDAGRLKAQYRANTAGIDIALTAYNQAVLTAVRETSDQLSDIASLDLGLLEQQRSLDNAEEAFRLATKRYDAGLTTYLTVLTTETQVLAARRQHIDLEWARASAGVTLIIDVGGDFRPDSSARATSTGG
jgi:NodT family efflux transporter outer membrane factor (OMF) lipoprotein